MEGRKPVHEVKIGRVRATIWPAETRRGTLYSVVVARWYESEGKWKSSTSLDHADLLHAAKALDVAESWVRFQLTKKTEKAHAAEEAK